MLELKAAPELSTAQLPSTWRQTCVECLEPDVDGKALAAQSGVAVIMATLFLMQHNMPHNALVRYDISQLPPSPEPGITAVCHSCIVNFAAEGSSMSAADDREKLAHCHACLAATTGLDVQTVYIQQMVSYGLASRMVGKFVRAPPLRKLQREMAAGSGTCGHSTGGSCKPAGSKSDQAASSPSGAAASAADDAVGEMICKACSKNLAALSVKNLRGANQPQHWRQGCTTCLELNLTRHSNYYFVSHDDKEEFVVPARMQDLCAQHLTYLLFAQKGMPWGSHVTVDASKLPPSGNADISKECYSCVQRWVYKSDMAVAKDRKSIAHCYVCLKQYLDADDWENPSEGVRLFKEAVYYAVASRLIGKTVASPWLRGLPKAPDEEDSSSSSSSSSSSKRSQRSQRRQAAKAAPAAEQAGRSSKARAQQQTMFDAARIYQQHQDTAWWLSWVDSAWFKEWGGLLVVLLLVASLVINLWLSGRDSYLYRALKWVGSACRRDAAAGRAKRAAAAAAAAGDANTTNGRQQQRQQGRQQQGASRKQGKRKQAGKVNNSRGQGNLNSNSSSTRSRAPSREHCNEARGSIRDHFAADLHSQQVTASGEAGSGARVGWEQQQQQQQQQVMSLQANTSGASAIGDSNHAVACQPHQQVRQAGNNSRASENASNAAAAAPVQLDALIAVQS
jgi:hypothetical protein